METYTITKEQYDKLRVVARWLREMPELFCKPTKGFFAGCLANHKLGQIDRELLNLELDMRFIYELEANDNP